MRTKKIFSQTHPASGILKSLLMLLLAALAIRTLIFEPFFVPTGSMKPGLLEGDYVFATKYNYGYSHYSLSIPLPFGIGDKIFNALPKLSEERKLAFNRPQRGDIIIFFLPINGERYIKRLIGLPGDKVQVIDGLLYINDKPVEHKYVEQCYVPTNDKFYITDYEGENFITQQQTVYNKYLETLPNGLQYSILNIANPNPDLQQQKFFQYANNTEPFYIPAKKYFFMGDNRDNSNDSRLGLGFVNEEELIGKARFIHFSTAEPLWVKGNLVVRVKQIWQWFISIRWDRIFKSINA